ncbi:hypothetical protein RJD24_04775 [Bacillaceae bacterium IKA-2]|nr:hypothetical protein RJD24_04775 [Bacillaceae bacterium IKA-2]
MKRKIIVIIVFISLIISTLLYFSSDLTIQQTIGNFPIDENNQFSEVTTTLQLIDLNDDDEYTLEWKTTSETTDKIDLSHDIALLFEDGRLIEMMSLAKEKNTLLTQKLKIFGEDSGHFEAITFHYRQKYYPNDIIKSLQSVSHDQLYVLDSPLSPIETFKKPRTSIEIDGKKILDTIIQQNLQYSWQELIDYFHIDSNNYHLVPLTSLVKFNEKSLPSLTAEETKELLGTTWSALYKHYFLGIEKQDGTIVSAIGSSVPLVLFNKSYSHIAIIFISKDGTKYNIIKKVGK